MKYKINFYKQNISLVSMEKKEFKYKKSLKDVKRIFKEISKEVKEKNKGVSKIMCSIHFVNTERMRELNSKHRSINKTTDVLSFPHNDYDEKWFYLGDVFINENIIKSQSKEINSDELTEIKFLSMHGLLHLIGYDHIETKEEKKMLNRQKDIFKKLGIRKW